MTGKSHYLGILTKIGAQIRDAPNLNLIFYLVNLVINTK
jgi:hypothetical protein